MIARQDSGDSDANAEPSRFGFLDSCADSLLQLMVDYHPYRGCETLPADACFAQEIVDFVAQDFRKISCGNIAFLIQATDEIGAYLPESDVIKDCCHTIYLGMDQCRGFMDSPGEHIEFYKSLSDLLHYCNCPSRENSELFLKFKETTYYQFMAIGNFPYPKGVVAYRHPSPFRDEAQASMKTEYVKPDQELDGPENIANAIGLAFMAVVAAHEAIADRDCPYTARAMCEEANEACTRASQLVNNATASWFFTDEHEVSEHAVRKTLCGLAMGLSTSLRQPPGERPQSMRLDSVFVYHLARAVGYAECFDDPNLAKALASLRCSFCYSAIEEFERAEEERRLPYPQPGFLGHAAACTTAPDPQQALSAPVSPDPIPATIDDSPAETEPTDSGVAEPETEVERAADAATADRATENADAQVGAKPDCPAVGVQPIKRKRMPRKEAIRLGWKLANSPGFDNDITRDKFAEQIGCSTGQVSKSFPPWKAVQLKKSQNRCKQPAAVALSPKIMDETPAREEVDDGALDYLMKEATPEERDRINGMSKVDKDRLANLASAQIEDDDGTSLDQDSEISTKRRKGM